jgi:hypothetical protein
MRKSTLVRLSLLCALIAGIVAWSINYYKPESVQVRRNDWFSSRQKIVEGMTFHRAHGVCWALSDGYRIRAVSQAPDHLCK